MTLDEFLVKLEKLRYKKSGERLKWRFIGSAVRVGKGPVGICPVCSVCRAEGRRKYHLEHAAAALEIGLPYEIAAQIAFAADRAPGCCDMALRARILKACGLKEVA
jgi:hypothetical protein